VLFIDVAAEDQVALETVRSEFVEAAFPARYQIDADGCGTRPRCLCVHPHAGDTRAAAAHAGAAAGGDAFPPAWITPT
jgi:hypothetical protein